MWDMLTWRDLASPEINSAVDELKTTTLRLLIAITTAGYLAWHFGILTIESTFPIMPSALRYWLLFPIVTGGLFLSFRFQQRQSARAAEVFLGSSILSISAATWLLDTPWPTIFYPLVVLVAVVLLQPLAGFFTSMTSIGLLLMLWRTGLGGPIHLDRVVQTSVLCLLTVAVAWVLGRNLVIAVRWSLDSYVRAVQNARDAQSHRAQLVQALKQLDNAYYRLERANAALELAWRAAEAAERSKSEFVANISHELRTPLNLVIGFSEMILTSPESYGEALPAVYRGDLNAIYRSAQHLLMLAEDVLDLTQVGIGRLALAREPVDLDQVIRDACELVREYIEAKGLQLRVEVPVDLPFLNADRLRIRQVLLNLLTNAARFTERGSITVSASVSAGWISVKVVDTGRGIGLVDLPKVFEQFYHVETGESGGQTGFGGVGLGLPLSKRLVELHGGQMGVESSIGAGTTFWFTLPVSSFEGTPTSDGWQPPRLAGVSQGRERILILVGSDGRLAQFFQRHLRGYRVVNCPDMRSAIKSAVEERAFAILADSDDASRGADRESPVPLIRLPLPRPSRTAAALGATASLVKPVTRADLRDVLEHLGRPIQTALIADDDPHFVRLMARYLRVTLRQAGIRVTSAHTGQEALTMIRLARPDVVLLDLLMPDLDGQKVLASMRADPELTSIPVIIVSAREQSSGQCPLTGELSISRPEGFQLEELLATIEALLDELQPPRWYLRAPVRPASSGVFGA